MSTQDDDNVPLTHEAKQKLHQDVQRDAARAREASDDHAADLIEDAEITEAQEGVDRHYDAN